MCSVKWKWAFPARGRNRPILQVRRGKSKLQPCRAARSGVLKLRKIACVHPRFGSPSSWIRNIGNELSLSKNRAGGTEETISIAATDYTKLTSCDCPAPRHLPESRFRKILPNLEKGVSLYFKGFGFGAADARRAPFASMTPFQGSWAWGRSAVPELRPGPQ